jgi:thiosulfate/3-mercaptopyruvate sulfurtransferase
VPATLDIAPPEKRGYADHSIFVTTEWLEKHLYDPKVRVLDTDGAAEYGRVHIPDSLPVLDHYYKAADKGRTHIQGPDEFSKTMSGLGISDDTLVVGYDSQGGLYSFRLAWSLHYYGHQKVKVLDGGFPRWLAESRALSRTRPQFLPGKFHPKINREIFAGRDDVLGAIGRKDTVLLDVRADDEWTGVNKRDNVRGGHIPGAIHLEWKNFLTKGDVPTVLPAADLREMLHAIGVTPDKKIITY